MGTERKGEKGWGQNHLLLEKSADEIWLLTTYSKNEKATIKGHILKKIAEEIENE